MTEDKEYFVLDRLPDNGEECLCYGYFTYCCKEDMEEKPDWHKVTFRFAVSIYKLKKELPEDIEDTILQDYMIVETWRCGKDFTDGKVIGVTKWKKIMVEI